MQSTHRKQDWRKIDKNERALSNEPASIMLEQALPCSLHMENRVGEKLTKMLLLNALEERQFLEKQELELFLVNFETIVNTQILGSFRKPSQWKVPRAKDSANIIGEINLDNKRTRLIVSDLAVLIHFRITDPAKRLMWLNFRDYWEDVIVTLRQKYDFTNDEIISFQLKSDKFFLE